MLNKTVYSSRDSSSSKDNNNKFVWKSKNSCFEIIFAIQVSFSLSYHSSPPSKTRSFVPFQFIEQYDYTVVESPLLFSDSWLLHSILIRFSFGTY